MATFKQLQLVGQCEEQGVGEPNRRVDGDVVVGLLVALGIHLQIVRHGIAEQICRSAPLDGGLEGAGASPRVVACGQHVVGGGPRRCSDEGNA